MFRFICFTFILRTFHNSFSQYFINVRLVQPSKYFHFLRSKALIKAFLSLKGSRLKSLSTTLLAYSFEQKSSKSLKQRQLNFFCTGPTDSNFWQFKIIILILNANVFRFTIQFSPKMIFSFCVAVVYKRQTFSALEIVKSQHKKIWSLSKHKLLYLDDQYFYFLFCRPLN